MAHDCATRGVLGRGATITVAIAIAITVAINIWIVAAVVVAVAAASAIVVRAGVAVVVVVAVAVGIGVRMYHVTAIRQRGPFSRACSSRYARGRSWSRYASQAKPAAQSRASRAKPRPTSPFRLRVDA